MSQPIDYFSAEFETLLTTQFENDQTAFGKDHLIMHTSRSLTNSNHSNYHD